MAGGSVFDFTVTDIDGNAFPLSNFKGQVLLVVNVASQCGFTPQYVGLEELYKKYQSQGFSVVAFPCNQFGSQEPGSNEEIKCSIKDKFSATFPMMSKVDVNGDKVEPLFKHLKKELPGILGTTGIKWNFTKFLVDRKGVPIERYGPTTSPESIHKDIEKALAVPA